ncbi:DUF3298 and DUF4163 domain-containing protein [Alcanivorax sp. S6407]|uniref:DUF3298 and DUF4163 domain-containing protein n=1 Tax=Alcanivorax sp. S6407 TaxID=2926424 RepID=UPI001FF1C8A6|nr:DUF3298 and DUF4163 domain-containing protein [Alcanivorax sp. S6407]MCK0154576.1 DUF3298 and DUF4163 domain-containing protein [Alcanivorax sp. S6407]
MRMTMALLFGLLLLSGCDNTDPTGKTPADADTHRHSADTPRPPTRIRIELKKSAPQCDGKGCPSVQVNWLNYEQQPVLNKAIETRLAAMMVRMEGDAVHDGSIEGLADAFLADAADMAMASQQGWELRASVKQQRIENDLLTLSMESYEYTGGAHGQPNVGYFHWDLQRQQWLKLEDLLVPGKESDFWTLAQQVHRDWLDAQQLDQTFRESWPFEKTDDGYFNGEGMVLQYNVYHIAPYAMGQPKLVLPYEKLKGIVRQKYLPD